MLNFKEPALHDLLPSILAVMLSSRAVCCCAQEPPFVPSCVLLKCMYSRVYRTTKEKKRKERRGYDRKMEAQSRSKNLYGIISGFSGWKGDCLGGRISIFVPSCQVFSAKFFRPEKFLAITFHFRSRQNFWGKREKNEKKRPPAARLTTACPSLLPPTSVPRGSQICSFKGTVAPD